VSRRETEHHGVLILDKPSGLTSHDVVQRIRRLARTSRVGHAGTLDPMATGVLVVMVGEATKLGPYLTAEDKRYLAEVSLGRSTDTLDAEGRLVAEAPLPPEWATRRDELVEEALALERARTSQVPPAFSAISVDGVRAHALARRGEAPTLEARPVEVRALRCLGASDAGRLSLEVSTSRGYYVRSLARDLGLALGCPAHLSSLRRVASGAFVIDDAMALDAHLDADTWAARLLAPPEAARRAMPVATLLTDAVLRARQGKHLGDHEFVSPAPEATPAAWLSPDGSIVAVGVREAASHRVLRGFV
jgi:tRNA pseudouridine55 synthase